MLIQDLIKSVHFLSKPNLSIKFSRKVHSTRSYALLISRFKAIEPVFPVLLFFRWCKVSKATRMLSVIRQLDGNVLWDSETSFGRHFLRRLAMVLEISLYMTLQRLMGWKSLAILRDFVLGMRLSNVWFIFGGMVPKFSTERVAERTSGPTMFQKCLKKIGGIPSGPSAEMDFICFNVASTSLVVYSLVNSRFICGVTFLSIP